MVLKLLLHGIHSPITMSLFSRNLRIGLGWMFMTTCALAQDIPVNCDWTVYTFPNGTKASEGCLIDGKPEGTWKTFHSNGNLKSIGSRLNFELSGEWQFFDTSGVKTQTIEYQSGKKHGWERTYFQTGLIAQETHFEQGIRSGWMRDFDANGQLRKAIPFRDDREDGKGREYAEDGRTIALLDYVKGYLRNIEAVNRFDSDGEKTGIWMEWNGANVLIEQGPWQAGKRNGLFRFYDQWGQLDRVEKYLDGEVVSDAEETAEIDVRTTVHANGVIASKGTYENGVRVGVYTEYNEQGSAVAGAVYEEGKKVADGITNAEGKRSGKWTQYYPSGAKKSEGDYQDGLRENTWKFYAETGELIQEGAYREGEFHGNWKWYYLDGRVHRDESYRLGKPNGMFREWDRQGKLIVNGEYDLGLKQGIWVVDINDHREEGNYLDGERHGIWKHTYPDGTEQFEGEFEIGLPKGKHVYRDETGALVRVERYEYGRRDGKWVFYGPQQILLQTLEYRDGELVRIDGQRINDRKD